MKWFFSTKQRTQEPIEKLVRAVLAQAALDRALSITLIRAPSPERGVKIIYSRDSIRYHAISIPDSLVNPFMKQLERIFQLPQPRVDITGHECRLAIQFATSCGKQGYPITISLQYDQEPPQATFVIAGQAIKQMLLQEGLTPGEANALNELSGYGHEPYGKAWTPWHAYPELKAFYAAHTAELRNSTLFACALSNQTAIALVALGPQQLVTKTALISRPG